MNGEAKAYPIQYLGYHHQVADEVGGKPVLVTYCTVCRTGRVYDPVVNGKREKFRLNEIFSTQTSLATWSRLHPLTLVMQPDTVYKAEYDSMKNYETGKGKSNLTRTDTLSWQDKSWVVGIKVGKISKAYDWNILKKQRLIEDKIDGTNVIVLLSDDASSFFAFEKPFTEPVTLQNDTIFYKKNHFRIDGKGIDTTFSLKALPAYQEFWHSWRTFHPGTKK